jgi:ABC-2 type transport system ATP-binding protein
MRDDGTTVVLATPLAEDVAAVCTEVIVLAAGRTLFSGTTGALAGAGETPDPPGPGEMLAGYHRLLAGAGAVAG